MFFSQSKEEYEVVEKFTLLLRVDEFSSEARKTQYEGIKEGPVRDFLFPSMMFSNKVRKAKYEVMENGSARDYFHCGYRVLKEKRITK